MKNKYVKRSKISEAKFREILKCFSHELDAQTIAALAGLNRNTCNRYLHLVRKRIAQFCEQQSPFNGKIEAIESNSGSKQIVGEQGRKTEIKVPVFGVIQHEGKVYTEVVPDCNRHAYQAVIRGNAEPESIMNYSDWRGYNGLMDLYYKKPYSVHDENDESAKSKEHINCIDSFWSFAKRRIMKFYGMSEPTFYLHLKECEFRFNYRNQDIYVMLLKMIRDDPLF